MQKKNTNKGFSLIELIIMIAILAVLIGVIAPQYLKYVEHAKRVVDVSTAKEIANSLERVFAIDNPDMRVNGGYYTAVAWDKSVQMPTESNANAFIDYIFLDLGQVPQSATYKNFFWVVDYDVHYGYAETIELYNRDTGKHYQLYPNADEFLK